MHPYIGWVGNVEKSNLSKCYVSTLYNKSLEKMYTELVCHFPVELIINAQKDMNSVFFSENNDFCHFHSHNEFYLSVTPTKLTLEDSLNFVPSHEIVFQVKLKKLSDWPNKNCDAQILCMILLQLNMCNKTGTACLVQDKPHEYSDGDINFFWTVQVFCI